MHAYAPFGCLCVGSVRSVFQIPWPPCSFFTVLQLALLLVLEFCIGFVTRCCSVPSCVRVGRSLHVCCSSLHQKEKKTDKGKARRIPRPVFASPISRPEHTRQRITARTLMSFFAVCTHSTAQALIYLWSGDRLPTTTPSSYTTTPVCSLPRRPRIVPQNVQILQDTCVSRCTRTARTSLNILRILSHAADCDGKMVLYRGTSYPILTITQVAVHGPDVEVELRGILLLALL